VYEYVGSGNGTHSPLAPFTAPKSLNIQSLEFGWKPVGQLKWKSSLALGNQDLNTLSSRNDANNLSLAGRTEMRWQPHHSTQIKLQYQQTDSSFAQFDRIREAEFERQWGGLQDGLFGEQIISADLIQKFGSNSEININYGQLQTSRLQADRYESRLQWAEYGFSSSGSFRYVDVKAGRDPFQWLQWKQNLRYEVQVGNWKLQPAWNFEWDERSGAADIPNISLIGGQRPYFLESGPEMLLSGANQRISAGISYREEEVGQQDTELRTSYLYRFGYELNKKQFRTENKLSWFDIPGQPSFSINHQSAYTNQKRESRIRLAYQADSRLQGRLIEVFTFVGPQFGQYFWDDLNDDGIEQLDEFFPERSPEEGTHILQFLPADELEGITRIQSSLQFQSSIFKLFGWNYDGDLQIASRLSILEESTSNRIGALLRLDSELIRNTITTLQGRNAFEHEINWKSAQNLWQLRLFNLNNESLNQRNGFSERTQNLQYGFNRISAECKKKLEARCNLEKSVT